MEKARFLISIFLMMVFITALFWVFDFDQRAARYFYMGGGQWRGESSRYLAFFYFPMNAILFSIPVYIGLVLLSFSFVKKPSFKAFHPYRIHGAFLVFMPLLGAGLFNSVILKMFFARPRPIYYIEEGLFYYPFQIAMQNWGGVDMSFPSGHVSMAAVFMVFYFVFEPSNHKIKRTMQVILGVYVPIWASLSMIVSRSSFGDHFVSDGVFAVFFVYFLCYAVSKWLRLESRNRTIEKLDKVERNKSDLAFMLAGLLIPVLLIIYFLIRFDGLRTFGA